MDQLNIEQQKAVDALKKGSVAVIAGPGSGKTQTLTAAVQVVLTVGIKASDILCLTFTKKAADNLSSRIGQRSNLFVGTFHALAHRLLGDQLEGQHLMKNDETDAVLTELKVPGLTVRELGLQISRAKNGSLATPQTDKLLRAYNALLADRGWFDYDDLIIRCHEQQLQAGPAKQYKYIFVDEFQDTSPRQYELLQSLAGPGTKLFVIGDPHQSIYRFRGADGSVFARFSLDFKSQILHLSTNYRSAGTIVSIGNKIFPDKSMQTAFRTDRGMVRHIETLDEFSEAEYVLSAVEQSLGGTSWERTHHDTADLDAAQFSDFAVLYRTRRQGEVLADKLRAAGLPVQRLGEESPYAAKEARLIQTALNEVGELAENPDTAVREVLAKLHMAPSPVTLQFENLAVRFENIKDFLGYIEDVSAQEYFDPAADAIVLSTIHSSKGLEFKHVFVVGCVDGVLPNKRAKTEVEQAEEHRLFYVALTRARDTLTLLSTKKFGGKPARPSPFLKLLNLPSEPDNQLAVIQKRRTKSRLKRSQQSLF